MSVVGQAAAAAGISTIDYVTAYVVLAVAVGVAFGSAAVVWAYRSSRLRAPRKHGLLVWHIATVGGSHALTWVTLGLGQLDILDIVATPRWVRLVLYSVSGLGTLVSLFLIGLEVYRRGGHLPLATPVIRPARDDESST